MKTEEEPYITPHIIQYQLANLKQLTFEITDDCNLNCTYCGYGKFYEDYDKRESKKLDTNKAKCLINYLMKLWDSNMNVSADRNVYISFYGGEPLLNMEFIEEIVGFVKKQEYKNRHFTFTMTTNAILLNKYMI